MGETRERKEGVRDTLRNRKRFQLAAANLGGNDSFPTLGK
jgi:hypothetical protein